MIHTKKAFSRKHTLYAKYLEAERLRELTARRRDRYEDKGDAASAMRANIESREYGAQANAFLAAIAVVYGEYGDDLWLKLKAFQEAQGL